MKRRICWPNPDAVCLQGGCGYCNYSRFRAVSTIESYARRVGLYGDFLDGYESRFRNADVID